MSMTERDGERLVTGAVGGYLKIVVVVLAALFAPIVVMGVAAVIYEAATKKPEPPPKSDREVRPWNYPEK